MTLQKSSHAGAIQSGTLKGLSISSDGNRSTQYKILKDALPVYCAEQSFAGVGEIVSTQKEWDETTFYPAQPTDVEKATFATQYNTLLCVRRTVVAGSNVDTPVMGNKWVVFDETIQQKCSPRFIVGNVPKLGSRAQKLTEIRIFP